MPEGDLYLQVVYEDGSGTGGTVDLELTDTARRMMETLPIYYHGVPFFQRLIQALANRVDEADALIDKLEQQLIPASTTDELALLSAWEAQTQLPVAQPGLTETQRRAQLQAHLQSLGASSSRDVLAALGRALGGAPFTFQRNTPGMLRDLVGMPFGETQASAAQIARIAARLWPAHRVLAFRYGDGFILDVSELDSGLL